MANDKPPDIRGPNAFEPKDGKKTLRVAEQEKSSLKKLLERQFAKSAMARGTISKRFLLIEYSVR
jgi:hypothetical protein